MIKLLIVDDEPLVQIGIKSMLNWIDYNIEICGTASNGEQALNLIEQHMPEIVITDIKMPIMNGLELVKNCKDQYGNFPLFIILTSYEEFPLIKEAIKYGIIDYLVKLELTAEILSDVINKALEIVYDHEKTMPTANHTNLEINTFYEKFFITLLHNLFDNEDQFWLQANYLNLDFSTEAYTVCHCSITSPESNGMEQDKLMNLYISTIHMIKDMVPKYLPCYISSLDIEHFCIIFCLSGDDCTHYKDKILEALTETFTMIHNYFNVTLTSCIGNIVSSPFAISDSYQESRQIQGYCTKNNPIVFFEDYVTKSTYFNKNTFNMGLFKNDIRKAFEEYDSESLSNTLTQIIDLFRMHPTKYLQAIDAACNILYLALSLLPEGEETLMEIYSSYPGGYRSIYKHFNIEQVIHWMEVFREGLYHCLKAKHKNYKNNVILDVKTYIDEHIEEKLSLNDIASIFGISPNYLSLLFKKISDIGFSEYITQKKISRAKILMVSDHLKIYEISEQLGFENAFYFSKVFKKVEGCSPREYLKNKP